ncbi:MAG: LysR family transcriptional regulator [Chloroflexi bacterium]|nr:LysR family transcriptional regulator [Chloroflexota bacterium]
MPQLDAFARVARARSFSRAARALDLAQPTISGRIAALEAALGERLFHRRGHTLELTDAGRALLPYAERLLTLRAEAIAAVAQSRAGTRGRLALGAVLGATRDLVPRLLGRLWAAQPHIQVVLSEAAQPETLTGWLIDGAVELAVMTRESAHPRAEVLWTWTEQHLLVGAAGHPLAQRGACRRADLVGQRFGVTPTSSGPLLERLLVGLGEADIVAIAGSNVFAAELACRGEVLALAPRGVVAADLATGRLREIRLLDAAVPPVDIVLVRWAARPLSPAAGHLLAATQGWQPPGDVADE